MTVPSETSKSGPYIGNGVTTTFDITFKVYSTTHIKVIVTEDGVDYIRVSGFSIVGIDGANPTIVFDSPPASGDRVTILREVPQSQELDLVNQGAYFAEDIERSLDLAAMRDQQLQEQIDRAVVVQVGSETLPEELIADLIASSLAAIAAASAAAASAAEALAKQNSMLRARGAFATATLYSPSDQYTSNGTVYLTLAEHTSTNVAADLASGKVMVWVEKGAAGAGTGDMLKSENLSGINVALSLANLGFSTLGIALRGLGGISAHTPGTNAQGQGPLAINVSFAYCTTVASISGVTLPAGIVNETGRQCVIVNPSGSTASINVYPASGGNFEGRAANASVAVPPGWRLIVWQQTITQWAYMLLPLSISEYVDSNPMLPFATFNFDGTAAANVSGTYVRSGTTVTCTITGHGHLVGHVIRFAPTTGAATAGNYVVTSVADANTFTFTHAISGAASGNVTLERCSIRKSRGVQSVSDLGVGTYHVNFSALRSDALFTPIGNSNAVYTGLVTSRGSGQWQPRDLSTSGFAILTQAITNVDALGDAAVVTGAVFG